MGAWAPEGGKYFSVDSADVRAIAGVDNDDMRVVRQLLRVWRDKYPGNVLRSRYYDARNRLKDFSIAIPEKIRGGVTAMIGWPELAVRSLSDLSELQGFAVGGSDRFGVSGLFEDNELDSVVAEAVVSAYKHSCSFLTVSEDPDAAGRMLITPRSAEWSSGLWDYAAHRLRAVLTLTDCDESGRVTGFHVWLPGRVYACARPAGGGRWGAERFDTFLPEPTAVALAYDRQLDRPFGSSRISRPLMSLVDIAFRSMARMEATSEFYSSPKLWALGLDPEAFTSDTWSHLMNAINSVSRDEDGNVPEIKQVEQASMSPHTEMMRSLAMLCASITRVPVDYMGITLSNPTSAEAMASAERRLTRIADRQNTMFGRAVKRAVRIAVQLRDGLREAPAELAGVSPVWAPTREDSDAARADAFAKVAGLIPGYAESDVGLERLGLTREEIIRFRADRAAARAREGIDRLREQAGAAADGE